MKNKHIQRLSVVVIELISFAVAFVLAPFMAQYCEQWIWITIDALLLSGIHLIGCYYLRRMMPLWWFLGFPINVIGIIIWANIQDPFFIKGLENYGMFSVYTKEFDIVLTFLPYYVDAFFYASLIVSFRAFFAIPVYYFVKAGPQTHPSKK